MKVIYIISFPPAYNFTGNTIPEHKWFNYNGELVGVWRQDWGHVFAQNIKSNFPEIEYEVWRPDYRADKEYIHTFDDGIVHRSFPSRKRLFFRGIKPVLEYYSHSLVTSLSKLIHEREKTRDMIVHIPADFSYIGYRLLIKFNEKVPFLHTVHLNPGLLNIKLNTLNPFRVIHRYLIKCTYDYYKKLLREIAVSEEHIEFFRENTKADIYKLDFLNFDFCWGNNRIPKLEARKLLNLPLSRKIIFSSSRLVPEKQIDRLIEVLAGLSQYDFLLIISGTGKTDYVKYLKNLVKRQGLQNKILFTGFLDDLLIHYYCASDVFISTSISEAGPVSVFKSMSLGIPIISTNTGTGASLLDEYNAGLIIDKNNPLSWTNSFQRFFSGEEIKTIDPDILRKRFDSKSGIKQLVSYYQKSINNFWAL